MDQNNDQEGIKRQVARQTAGYILTALGLVVGLAWNDTVKAFIDVVFPIDKTGVVAKFIYAIVLTLVVILIVRITNKFLEKKQ